MKKSLFLIAVIVSLSGCKGDFCVEETTISEILSVKDATVVFRLETGQVIIKDYMTISTGDKYCSKYKYMERPDIEDAVTDDRELIKSLNDDT